MWVNLLFDLTKPVLDHKRVVDNVNVTYATVTKSAHDIIHITAVL